ncbi:hypothetical protein [Janthinobacterium sp. BJB304]|uniref:hypothetical protein n=1 Tax=Janthinobacterium sp. BJB304 TaxID=1572871 RepID=UPI000C0ED64E|nr:hypothetical protein [Janthinobacterium sp. BJB304]PHV38588.1 hypothetical protein CSQ95_12235 [Janthinobacterium sp. BJB304]
MTMTTNKPFALKLSGNSHRVFQELCTHVRNGYVINPDAAVDVIPATGQAFIHLILGEPLKFAEEAAQQTINDALALEQVEFERRVKAEAARIVAEDKATTVRKQLAEQAAQHAKEVKRLEKELAAIQ